MFLAVDIGNSFVKFGLFDGDTLTSKFSIPTKRDATSGDIAGLVGDRLNGSIASASVCSVVPTIDEAMSTFLRETFDVDPVFVRNEADLGLKISYEPLESLGTDRLVAAYAAVERHGSPSIVCSLGTATTIDAVSKDREFLGGVIAPGIEAMSEALYIKAPRLPRVDASRLATLLGNSTRESIQSGVYNGYLAMVSGLIQRFKETVGPDAKVIATGGNAGMVGDECRLIDIVDPDLVLNGLNMIGRR